MADLNINFRWVSNAQDSRSATVAELKRATNGFARIIVRDVAIAASKRYYQEARRALIRGMEAVINNEMNRMAKAIGSGINTQDAYRGPQGRLSIQSDMVGRGGPENGARFMSDTARNLGWSPSFNVSSTGIKWDARNPKYLRQKARKGKGGYWWRKNGALQDWLKNISGSTYEKAFGPVKVVFVQTGQGSRADNVTTTGAPGRVSQTVAVGRIQVNAFGRITPSMLPGLADMDPTGTVKSGKGIARLLETEFPRNRQIYKLLTKSYSTTKVTKKRVPLSQIDPKAWRAKTRKVTVIEKQQAGGNYRPAIDPFVSFYLTRAVPNAIWRRTERFVQDNAIVRNL